MFFIFKDIEMPFTDREKAFCVLEYARSQSNKTVQHAFAREFSKQLSTAMQIWTLHKKLKEERVSAGEKNLGDHDIIRDGRVCSQKNPAKPKGIVTENNSGNPDSPTTVWHILRKCLIMKPYKLQLVQAITADDKQKCKPN